MVSTQYILVVITVRIPSSSHSFREQRLRALPAAGLDQTKALSG